MYMLIKYFLSYLNFLFLNINSQQLNRLQTDSSFWAGCVVHVWRLCYGDFSEKSKLGNVELGYSTWMGDRS